MTPEEHQRRVSDQFVRLIQIVFGVVVSTSLVQYQTVLVDPFDMEHRLAFIALVSVYATAVMSWIDWHPTMERNPYRQTEHGRLAESSRLIFDLLVVVMYAYLLFTIRPFETKPDADITRHLLGYPLVFVTYFLAGTARRWRYGTTATNLLPILLFGAATSVLTLDYVFDTPIVIFRLSRSALNAAIVALMLSLMLTYRVFRRWYASRRATRRESARRVAVDLDGVLGNQIRDVLPQIRKKYGVDLREEDITHWRYPINGSDIAAEIGEALRRRDYVVKMPMHRWARWMLVKLGRDFIVEVTTARPSETEKWTSEWLLRRRLPHDSVITAKEALKSAHGADVLVDDYLGNISEFLTNTSGGAVLVQRPWNADRDEDVLAWIDEGRLRLVSSLHEVPVAVRGLTMARPIVRS